jgi:P pilus assembly chaperone PapD
MNVSSRIFILLVLLTSFFASVGVSVALAQSPEPNTGALNITLSPITVNLETNPGQLVSTPLRVRNNGTAAETLKVEFGTFVADETGQRPRLVDPKPEDTFMQWITVDEPLFTVQPGEWKTINLTYNPPADAALSYYYTVIFSRPDVEAKPGEAVIQGAPAILVLSTVRSPNARRQLEVVSFKAKNPVAEYLPQTFLVEIQNTGNVHAAPQGNIFIDGQGKQDVAVLSLNGTGSMVLPQSSRTFEVIWNDGFPVQGTQEDAPEESKSGVEFMGAWWDFSRADRFRAGKYSANLLMVYDNGERDVPIESLLSFWVIPWKILLVLLAVLAFTLLGVFSLLRPLWRLARRSSARRSVEHSDE